MKNRLFFLLLFIFFAYCRASIGDESLVESRLKPYQTYLEQGTYVGFDWSTFKTIPKSRYETYKTAFEHVASPNKVIVELGTSRSFTHGGHPGCNLSDPKYWTPDQPENWDWGAGFFTRMAATALYDFHPQIYTVDICAEHIQRCKIITSEFKDIISYHVSSSEDFLRKCHFPNGIDLLYLDTGDMTPLEPTAQLHLREAKIIVARNLIAKNGLILIDDVKNQTPKALGEKSDLGKAKYSLPFFLKHGFELVMDEYQVLLRKSK